MTVKQISQVLKLHLGSKAPSSPSASLRKYSSYVEPVESGPPMRWQLKPEGIAKLRALSDLALAVVESGTAFDTDVGIVCALEQPEFDAVREALGGAKAWKEIGDERVALKSNRRLSRYGSCASHLQLKEASLHYRAYDAANFAAHIKSFVPDVGGTKESGFTLTARGLTTATDLIRGMLASKS